MSKKINFSITILFLSLIMLVCAVYSWFVITGSALNKVIISVGEISSEVSLYIIDDFNLDGNFDIPLEDTNEDGTINFKDSFGEDYFAIENEVTSILSIGELIPGQVVSFAIRVKNTGSSDSKLKFIYEKIDDKLNGNKLAQATSINFITENNLRETKLLSHSSYDKEVEMKFMPPVKKNQEVFIYFYLKFENLESLKSLYNEMNDDSFNSKLNLNEFINATFTLPKFIIRLEQVE